MTVAYTHDFAMRGFRGKHERRENRGAEGIEGVGRGDGRGVSSPPGEKSEEGLCPLRRAMPMPLYFLI